jgi:hypothetical protein
MSKDSPVSTTERLYALLKADERADTYVIPIRVMKIIAEQIDKERLEAQKEECIRLGQLFEIEKSVYIPEVAWEIIRNRYEELSNQVGDI